LALDVYFDRLVRRRGFHFSDNALTAASNRDLGAALPKEQRPPGMATVLLTMSAIWFGS